MPTNLKAVFYSSLITCKGCQRITPRAKLRCTHCGYVRSPTNAAAWWGAGVIAVSLIFGAIALDSPKQISQPSKSDDGGSTAIAKTESCLKVGSDGIDVACKGEKEPWSWHSDSGDQKPSIKLRGGEMTAGGNIKDTDLLQLSLELSHPNEQQK